MSAKTPGWSRHVHGRRLQRSAQVIADSGTPGARRSITGNATNPGPLPAKGMIVISRVRGVLRTNIKPVIAGSSEVQFVPCCARIGFRLEGSYTS